MWVFLSLCLAFIGGLSVPSSACPAQCSCFFHKLSDGTKARSVLCSDPELSSIPTDFPSDISKLRIEKTDITQISSEAFISLRKLEFLWMSFNSLSVLQVDSFRGLSMLNELRLEANFITSFPWESLTDMQNLRLLDLHDNKISIIPAEAAIYIKNLTYLDLSSNSLTTVPSEVLLMWLSAKPQQDAENSKMILGLHDNPWQCDCRLFDLIQFQKSPSSALAFIDTHLRCSEPESISGVLFWDVEIRRCQVPRVHTAVAKVHSVVGNNVLLRCGTVGVPMPELIWTRADGKDINGTVHEELSAEGITWSILSILTMSSHDSAKYICRATNFVGSTNAVISLVVSETRQISEVKKSGIKKNGSFRRAGYQEKPTARYIPTTSAHTEAFNGSKSTRPSKIESSSISNGVMDGKSTENTLEIDVEKNVLSNLAANASFLQQGPEKRVVRSVKIIGDTDHTVSINWRAPSATNTTWFSVLYAVFGERDMKRINVGPGKHRITIEGLVPKTKYIACVCVKGLIPKKEQCVIFSTDEAASASGTQKLINVVVITVACVIAVPLTLIVCCGALKRRLQKLMGRRKKDIQDSYVTFETITPGNKAKGMEGEFLAHTNKDESNRLLSARSSVDSEAVNKTESHPNEYYC
ncbi:leucine-rich repeat, immunoglobulin-like domain and transmembrane domain-containing protein 1b [Silurus meridionalis]|uniref:Leucine-rich repeat, immunoglobulin-like domain and transmembrane domain-containing protein 1 n=1 Tax=Silurus meridionalis TaxID=175797 RepID=A0A8T0BEY0_SILME|nr:leucine-rich repeat, immunoglobulin-like domain and transmembrane domain-containing protein 1b [Silurus meridionalis]KAF7705691.1 hypothetical protein HF521_020977 [Silurus meridionalis]